MRKFMKTRGAATPADTTQSKHFALKTNGHANGVGAVGDEHSSATRYWSGSESPLPASLWEDPQFPPTWRSIGDKKLAAGVQWLRPHELCARPTFRADDEPDELAAARWCAGGAGGAGEAGDARMCCAAGALARAPRLLARVAPAQSFRHHYTGAFRFRFWVFGTWREVTVDDRLPTRGGVLLSSRGGLHDDFTLPLLEKAYAKLYGSYAALRGGSVSRALQDLSGGVVQSFALAHQPRALTLQVLHSAAPRATLLVATSPAPAARACCVTGLARAPAGELVRVTGGATDDELWMSFAEFSSAFSALVLVHVGPDDWLREPALQTRRPWRAVLARRRWRRGYNAGGPPSCTETTGANPQFHMEIPSAECGGAHKVHVVVSVTQQYGAGLAGHAGHAGRAAPAGPERLHAVGFALYALPPRAAPRRPAAHSLHGLRALDVTHECRAREVVTFFTLPPGQYLVVPHTRRPNTEAAFLLRIFTDYQTHVWEVNDDNLIVHDLASEFPDEEESESPEHRAALVKLLGEHYGEEVDAVQLRAALRGARRPWLAARPSLELCRALVPLRDARVSGAVRARDVPALAALLAGWRAAWRGAGAGAACCSYRLRALLRAAGVRASNKVLECAALRYSRRARLHADSFLLLLARLHLAHERYRILDAKLKTNPLSLEEMILMTIYS